MNAAIIGTGFIASVHAKSILSQGHLITLVIASSIEKAEAFAKKYNIANYSCNMDDINSSIVDIVHICTPAALHFSMVKKCLEYNKHIICEKPLCINPEAAIQLLTLAKRSDLKVAVNYNVRYHTLMKDIRSLIQSDDFGELFMLHGNYLQEFHCLPTNYSWRYDPNSSGVMRAVTEIGSHIIDLIIYLTGLEIIEVSSNFTYTQKKRYLKDGVMYKDEIDGSEAITINSEDIAFVNLRLTNGAIGNFTFSEVSHGRKNHIQLEVTGSNKSVWWNSENPSKAHIASKEYGTQILNNPFANGFNETIEEFIGTFYNSIINDDKESYDKYPTLEDGCKNVIICDALLKSSKENGAWIKI